MKTMTIEKETRIARIIIIFLVGLFLATTVISCNKEDQGELSYEYLQCVTEKQDKIDILTADYEVAIKKIEDKWSGVYPMTKKDESDKRTEFIDINGPYIKKLDKINKQKCKLE